jgi:hypothetical protein
MPDITVKSLVEMRLPKASVLLMTINTNYVDTAIEEVKALTPYAASAENDLTIIQKGYLADLAAVALLKYSLDRYKEDFKAQTASDGLLNEAQNKLAYLQDMIARFEQDAQFKAARLGIGIVTAPPLVVKIGAADESDESEETS